MKKILVPVMAGKKNIWLIIHGMQLARRIRGKVYILEIEEDENQKSSGMEERIRSWNIINTQKKGVTSEYFYVTGKFSEEILKFSKRHKINTLVLELLPKKTKGTAKELIEFINKLRKQGDYRVELVSKKR